MSTLPTVLIIGCGSIGERHLRTFKSTGRCHVIACDTRPAILAKMQETYQVEITTDWQPVLTRPEVEIVVICTPAPYHVPIATAVLKSGRHCLIEKPLALSLEGMDELTAAHAASGRACHVAYVNHSRPEPRAAKAFLAAGSFGPVRAATVVCGQNFPTYRPAYREIYYNNHAQGGGAIQDAITHVVNLLEWILGPTASLLCDAGHQVLDGVEVEDTVSVVARNQDGAIISYNLNQFQAPNEFTIQFNAAKGSVKIEYHQSRWGHLALGATEWTWETFPPLDRDGPFIIQANDFLDACTGQVTPMATLTEGIQAVKFNLACFESLRTGARATI
ncbi:MAG: Gfo/Idh/MocA family oxidoreductase [Cephaloticoccus sp.]|nr:Gfo/Idh/MocA family oxidoreductase [Cephaloticoccus sp.]MCF7759387.1 Gfo/Idh/MocA family oxidoreductase [Cephaloticoccus sp.]